jgi:hypothetical protein
MVFVGTVVTKKWKYKNRKSYMVFARILRLAKNFYLAIQPHLIVWNSLDDGEMVVRIRLARFGKRHAPFYNIVVAHARQVLAIKSAQVLILTCRQQDR